MTRARKDDVRTGWAVGLCVAGIIESFGWAWAMLNLYHGDRVVFALALLVWLAVLAICNAIKTSVQRS